MPQVRKHALPLAGASVDSLVRRAVHRWIARNGETRIGTGSGAAGCIGTADAPTFTQIYDDIIVKYCASSACRNPGRSGGASFQTKSSAYSVFLAVRGAEDVADLRTSTTSSPGDPPFMPPLDPAAFPSAAAPPSWPPGSVPARRTAGPLRARRRGPVNSTPLPNAPPARRR